MVFGEHGPVLGHEHGAERLIANLEGLGRQLDTTLKVPKVGVGRRHYGFDWWMSAAMPSSTRRRPKSKSSSGLSKQPA